MLDHPKLMDFGPSIFICSKPLQLLHCASIVRRYKISDALLVLVTRDVSGHASFLNFISGSNHGKLFQEIICASSHLDAVDLVSHRLYDSLFIEDDRVSLYKVFVHLRTIRLIVFEEGIGTYVTSYRDSMRGLRLAKWMLLARITGCALGFGEGRRTDMIMVSKPNLFKLIRPALSHKVLSFPGLIDEIEYAKGDWLKLIEPDLSCLNSATTKLALILGTWGGLPQNYFETIRSEFEQLIYKPHPHDGSKPLESSFNVLPIPWVPAEAIIDILAPRVHELVVYHFSSSAAFYCQAHYKNVKFVDLDPSSGLRRLDELNAKVLLQDEG
jgi:hypothetical protein